MKLKIFLLVLFFSLLSVLFFALLPGTALQAFSDTTELQSAQTYQNAVRDASIAEVGEIFFSKNGAFSNALVSSQTQNNHLMEYPLPKATFRHNRSLLKPDKTANPPSPFFLPMTPQD